MDGSLLFHLSCRLLNYLLERRRRMFLLSSSSWPKQQANHMLFHAIAGIPSLLGNRQDDLTWEL
jgi:hypothetical protein